MRSTRVVVLMVAILLPAAAPGQNPAGPAAPDLQGTWRLVSVEYGGKTMALGGEDSHHPGRLLIAGNTFTYTIGDEKVAEGTFRVGPKCSPREVDASGTYFDTDVSFIEWAGIYKIEGDRLWLCGRMTGARVRPQPPAQRPTEFKTAWGDEVALGLFRRERR